MRRGTTPEIQIDTNISLIEYDPVIVTIESGGLSFDVTGDRLNITDTDVTFTLTQEETLSLGYAGRMQIKAAKGDAVSASQIMEFETDEILNRTVI